MQLKGSDGALGFYKLLVKLVAQKPMEFFKSHKDWLGGNGTEKPINAIFTSLIRKKKSYHFDRPSGQIVFGLV